MNQPSASATSAAARTALAQRLRAIADLVCDRPIDLPVDPEAAADAAAVLDAIVVVLQQDPTVERIWLLLTALAAAFPTREEVDDARRRLELDDVLDASLYLLDTSLQRAQQYGVPLGELDMLIGGVVVDVDYSARFNLHTGIQRVVRHLMPAWRRDHDTVAVAWTSAGGILRRLRDREDERVHAWAIRGDAGEGQDSGDRGSDPPTQRLVVPWRSVVVMAEVPAVAFSGRLAAIGSYSGNRLVGIAYDAIPIVSADLVPPLDSSAFVRYLTAVKFATRMAGISSAATAELTGFVQMLPTQGLSGPSVSEVSLPSPAAIGQRLDPERPTLILVVGSHEPRKNHLAVLHAAEILWREGLSFVLRFIGGSGWGTEFPRRVSDLAAAGRTVEVLRAVDDATLDRSFDEASFTVFPSLHEGYGLPVAESFAHGTPVITSNFGSTAEIAAGGGAVTVDPRDDKALTDAMRTLLTDEGALNDLRLQIDRRVDRNWDDYAAQLWQALVSPELADAAELTAGSGPLSMNGVHDGGR